MNRFLDFAQPPNAPSQQMNRVSVIAVVAGKFHATIVEQAIRSSARPPG